MAYYISMTPLHIWPTRRSLINGKMRYFKCLPGSYYLLLAVENVQIRKPKEHKGGEGDRSTQPNYKPEDILKLVMTAGEEKANLSPVNRTRQSYKQAQAGNPDECEHNHVCMQCILVMVLQYGYCCTLIN